MERAYVIDRKVITFDRHKFPYRARMNANGFATSASGLIRQNSRFRDLSIGAKAFVRTCEVSACTRTRARVCTNDSRRAFCYTYVRTYVCIYVCTYVHASSRYYTDNACNGT